MFRVRFLHHGFLKPLLPEGICSFSFMEESSFASHGSVDCGVPTAETLQKISVDDYMNWHPTCACCSREHQDRVGDMTISSRLYGLQHTALLVSKIIPYQHYLYQRSFRIVTCSYQRSFQPCSYQRSSPVSFTTLLVPEVIPGKLYRHARI